MVVSVDGDQRLLPRVPTHRVGAAARRANAEAGVAFQRAAAVGVGVAAVAMAQAPRAGGGVFSL